MPLSQQPPHPPKLKETKFQALWSQGQGFGSTGYEDQIVSDLGKLPLLQDRSRVHSWVVSNIEGVQSPFPLTLCSLGSAELRIKPQMRSRRAWRGAQGLRAPPD